MNNPLSGSRGWTRRRSLTSIGVVFVVQVAVVFLLNPRGETARPRADIGPVIRLAAGRAAEWLRLTDPTLFALASPQGFSGQAWLRMKPLEYHSAEWTEPPRLRDLPVEQLGATFAALVRTHAGSQRQFQEKPRPHLSPTLADALSSLPVESRVRLEGPLALRPLLRPMDLPALTSGDVLANSVVRVVVDVRGFPISTTLLESSGSAEPDRVALDLSRQARFEPVASGGAGQSTSPVSLLDWGKLIFQWRARPAGNAAVTPAAP